jgi:Fe-Mn family superoxide dismutase
MTFMITLILSAFVSFAVFAECTFMQQVDHQKAPFTLPTLPYSYTALEPFLDAKTMEIHHDRHHRAYVDNLNKSLAESKWLGLTLPELFTQASRLSTPIRNNAGGHWNHSFFWSCMCSPDQKSQMSEKLQKELEQCFGSVDLFKKQFQKSGLDRFGSGWTWLIRTKEGSLKIVSTANQDNPLMDFAEVPGTPLLTCDIWEHAYYLKYLNRRDSFLEAFWNLVNWKQVEKLAYQNNSYQDS